MEDQPSFKVHALESDNLFRVKVTYTEDHPYDSLVETFDTKEQALQQVQWLTHTGPDRYYVASIEVSHVLRFITSD